MEQVQKGFHGGPSSGEHDKGERDLRADQDIVSGASTDHADNLARTGLHDLADFGTRKLKGGPQAKENSGEKRDCHAEAKDRKIDLDSGFVRKGKFRQQ